jgi:hypothetical protein
MKEPTSKTLGQREKILALLKERGGRGVLNTELNSMCMRYGARIFELRRQGYQIETIAEGEQIYRFVLKCDVRDARQVDVAVLERPVRTQRHFLTHDRDSGVSLRLPSTPKTAPKQQELFGVSR